MGRKYFLKSQSSLRRKAVAGGLAATFAFGTVGSRFAGATEAVQAVIQVNDAERYKPKNIELKDIFVEDFDVESEDNLDLIKKIDNDYKDLEDFIFSDEFTKEISHRFNAGEEEVKRKWKGCSNKKTVVFNFFVYLKLHCDEVDVTDPKSFLETSVRVGTYLVIFLRKYKNLNNLSDLDSKEELSPNDEKISSEEKDNPYRDRVSRGQDDNLCKNLFHNKKIFWSVIVVALVISIFLIVYFVIPGGNKQGTVGTDEANSNSSQGGDNQVNNNELNPTEQKQTEENSGIKQGSGVGKKILKGSVASATGIGLVTSGTYLYGKISSKHKNATEQKAQNDNKKW